MKNKVRQKDFLQEQIHKIDRVLPIQAPLSDFVHFNPLMHYESMHFSDAHREVYQQTGALCYLDNSEYRDNFHKERITSDDLLSVLDTHIPTDQDTELFASSDRHFKRKDIYFTALTQDIKAINYRKLLWKIEVENALTQLQKDIPNAVRKHFLSIAKTQQQHDEREAVSALWNSCLKHFKLKDDPAHYSDFTDYSLLEVWQQIEDKIHSKGEQNLTPKELILQKSNRIKERLFQQAGKTITLRSLLKRLTDTDILDDIQPILIRQMSAWLDLGVSTQKEKKTQRFYHFWKEHALRDISPYLEGFETWYDYVSSLSDDPFETIANELLRIGIPQEDWGSYLKCLALEMPGWSGMFNWREKNPNYSGVNTSVEMVDYLAVRLTLEHLFCRHLTSEHWHIDATLPDLRSHFSGNINELFVRYYTYNKELPEYLQSISGQLLASNKDHISKKKWHEIAHLMLTWVLISDYIIDTKTYTRAWRLFHAAQHFALCSNDIEQLNTRQVDDLLEILQTLDDPNTSGYLWLQAYEHNYCEGIYNALLENHNKGNWPDRESRPTAQIIFCMDDREESIRRHLEDIAPDVETIGAAGVFGLPNNWQSLAGDKPVKLAQPVVTAIHQFNEIADKKESDKQIKKHQNQLSRFAKIKSFKAHDLRQSLVKTITALPVFAAVGISELIGRSFLPTQYQNNSKAIGEKLSSPITTRVDTTVTKVLESPSLEHNQIGLSTSEKVEKIAAYLKLTGFTKGYSRLVVLMSHRAIHTNNPHILAYGCGACSGRFGGPNARAFADIANTADIRKQLAEKHNIVIPNDCWFVAAEHETTGDYINYFDIDLIPDSHQTEFQELQQKVSKANQRHSQERCRKFASVPPNASTQKSYQHVQGRAASPSQIRAELGHQGCAVAFIGRRSMHQGVFWDRRPFLVSYDPFNDPEGKMLEAQLLGNGVVGVGIAFDYYYSRIQNGYLGSKNKATHNVVGLFGVMDGSSSDLQTGLARQMTELHEPMRLLVVLESELATVEAIYHRQDAIRNLVDKEWLILAVKNPNSAEIHQFKVGKGFVRWEGERHSLPTLKQSQNEYAADTGYLPPARITG